MKKRRLGIPAGISIQTIPFYALAFLCLLTSVQASAQHLLDRKISLTIQDVEIREALLHIETIADVKFVFSSTAILSGMIFQQPAHPLSWVMMIR